MTAYKNQLERINTELKKNWKDLSQLDVHDGILLWIDRDGDRSIVLNFDLSNSFGSDFGFCKVIFDTLHEVMVHGETEGDTCLYSEIDISSEGYPSFSLLLRNSEITIKAQKVELLNLDKK